MIPDLILIRGLPGSGKSTLAKRMADAMHLKHFEADDFFMHDGVYNYDASLIRRAHVDCLERTRAALADGFKVIVANTFSRRWELLPYTTLVQDCPVIECRGRYGSIHGVPDRVIRNMAARWEALP